MVVFIGQKSITTRIRMSDKSPANPISSTPKHVQNHPDASRKVEGKNVVLHEDASKKGTVPPQKKPQFGFKKGSSTTTAKIIATSQLKKSENESKKSNANEEPSPVSPSISPDDNKNADSRENQTPSIESSVKVPSISGKETKDADGKANEDPSLANKKEDQIPPGPSDSVPRLLTTMEKWERVKNALDAQLTTEDYKLMPKYIPEYESIFDGPWVLDQTPPYMDSSIPKGPTPPSPISCLQTQQITKSNPAVENIALWNLERAGNPLPSISEDEIANPWVLKNE